MQPFYEFIEQQKLEYLRRLMTEYPTVASAAEAARVNRTHLHKLVRDYGIRNPQPAHVGDWGDSPEVVE